MPQVDLESLFRFGGDRKVVCETLIPAQPPPEKQDPPATNPNFPAESFRLSRLEEIDWVQRNAVFERKESTRGNSMSTSIPSSTASSQRFSMNLKPKGLPKLQIFGYLGFDFRRGFRAASFRFIRKRPVQIGKPAVAGDEPASPKVSCMGRVKLMDNACSRKDHRRSSEKSQRKIRFWSRCLAVLRFGRGKKRAGGCEEDLTRSPSAKNIPAEESATETATPPSLCDLKRFSSCRRSSSWGRGDVDVDASRHVDESNTSDRDTNLRRRSVRPPPIDCSRRWNYAGPATI